jgi:hypothetical protein
LLSALVSDERGRLVGIIGSIFSLFFNKNGSNRNSVQRQQSSNPGTDRIQQVVATVMERQVLSASAATELLNSEFVKGKLNESMRERIEQAIEKVSEGQAGGLGAASNQTANPAAPAQQVVGNSSAPGAWRPDAITTGDANWHPDAAIKSDDPWHPDAGSKKDDPWHPDSGAKKNDPWHPGG